MTQSKKFYHGEFNWKGEAYSLFRWAHSEEQALLLFTNVIAKFVKRSGFSVFQHYKTNTNAYKIQQEEYKRR